MNTSEVPDPDRERARITREILPIVMLWTVLRSDVDAADAAITKKDSPFARRQFVRTALAKVEGLTSVLKQLALTSPDTYSASEITLLREETFALDEKGEPQATTANLKLASNIQFAFRMYAKYCGLRFPLPTSRSEWGDLRQAIRVRNRLMHPKALESLDVTNSELEATRRATNWIDTKWFELQELAIDKGLYEQGMSADDIRWFRAFRKDFSKRMPPAGGK